MTRSTCRHCHAGVTTATDDFGIEVIYDPNPISVYGECVAVIAGRATFQVIPATRRSAAEVWRRHSFSIGQPNDHGPLHCSHVCGVPPPLAWLAPIPDAIRITHQPNPEGEPQW